METSPRKLNRKFTYKDYLSWTDDKERWELIDGEAFDMSPAPTRGHQGISGFLFRSIGNYLDNNKCKVYAAPFDVRLPGGFKADSDVDTVVQPDISVFCDKTKLDDRGGNGSPDLIIEILSPSTASKDLKEKFFLYEKVGVKEYWIVDPSNKTLTAFILGEKGRYDRGVVYAGEDVLKTPLFEGLDIRMEEV
ncbi:MAG: Uma2 family endonuclease, partial [Spirochaetota bacterium]|nr:Uma2 family endonuclease [Spirochaetota bacterium]